MSTYYTSKYSGEQIDEAVKKIMDGEMTGDYADRQLSNLDTPQAALANLGAGVRPNIGDNCCFIGGGTAGKLPVNQRGAISGSTSADSYFIDRWQLQANLGNISYELDTDGLSFTTSKGNQGIKQILGTALETGKTYTSSVLTADGELLTKTFAYGSVDIVDSYEDGGVWSFAIIKANDLFVWHPLIEYAGVNTVKPAYVKLEEGSTQTLAYQDEAGAWQLLPQPESDYATQLAKCQRYQLELISKNDPQYACVGNGIGRTSGIPGIECPIFIPTPITLRTRPVVTFNGNFYLQSGDSSLQVTRMAIDRIATNGVNILVYAENIEIGKFYSLYATISENHSLLLDANL